MQRLIVGAPFGNYLSFPGATSTLGTFTLHRRAGPLGRLWRVLRTLRYHRRTQSWVNRLGLPNPGIRSLSYPLTGKIISLRGMTNEEWYPLVGASILLRPEAIELNLSCPNVGAAPIPADALQLALRWAHVIAKLPPVRPLEIAKPLYAAGVRAFHLCNTIPSPGGGISGKPLKQFSLWAVEAFTRRWGSDVILTGGGGVTRLQDAKDYVRAGADHVAIASMLLNPLSWRKVCGITEWLTDHFDHS